MQIINNTHMTNQSQECCPKFDPAPWDNKEFAWTNKRFIKGRVFTLFYMPMNFGSVMKKLNEKVQKAGATIQDGMWLSDHASKWSMDLYLAVDKEIREAENISISGKFLSKVYEGDFKNTGIWMKDFESFAKNRGMAIKKMYMWYTTCPKCAKKFGKNYVAIVARAE
ncbi:MAG: hydrolase [Patescibacteria group bacterium]